MLWNGFRVSWRDCHLDSLADRFGLGLFAETKSKNAQATVMEELGPTFFWVAVVASLFVAYRLGEILRRIVRPWQRLCALLAVMFGPLLGITIWLWGGDALGMGLAVLFPAYAGWALAALIGYVWGRHARKDQLK
jgi:hypothetical protein